MLNDDEAKIIDVAYEAAVMPDLWPKLCDHLSRHIGAFSTALITLAPGALPRWISSKCIAEQMLLYEKSGLAQRAERPIRGLKMAPNTFMRDIDILTTEELAKDALRVELLEPLGLAWELGGSFIEPSGSMFVFSQLMKTEHGPFKPEAREQMNTLKSDLARAAFLATRLGLKQAQSMTESLQLIGLAGAVVGDNGQIIAANQAFLDLAPRIQTGARDQLYFRDAGARALYGESITQIRSGKRGIAQSIPLASQDDDPPLVTQIIPIRRSARDIFSKSCALVVVTLVGEAGPPDLRVICGLFDLTRAEAIVAQKLTMGLSVSQIAATQNLSQETVRTHIKSLFRKTGVNRQSQLVRLLGNFGPAATEPS